jgi:hypothetical protein
MAGLTFDAGALIALERGSQVVKRLLEKADGEHWPVAIPAGALAQVWRDGTKQAVLARFLRVGTGGGRGAPTVEPMHAQIARRAGELCAAAGTADVVDASVVLCALMHDHIVVTSDPADLRRLAPGVKLFVV